MARNTLESAERPSAQTQDLAQLTEQSRRNWAGVMTTIDYVLLGLGVVLALVVALLLDPQVYRAPAFWNVLLVAIFVVLNAYILRNSLQQRHIWATLNALPGMQFDGTGLLLKRISYNVAWALFNFIYIAMYLDAQSANPLQRIFVQVFSSLPITAIFLLSLIVAVGGGNDLMHLKTSVQGIFIQDSLRPGLTGRMDWFYSIYGDFDEGFVVGRHIFLYREIERFEYSKKELLVLSLDPQQSTENPFVKTADALAEEPETEQSGSLNAPYAGAAAAAPETPYCLRLFTPRSLNYIHECLEHNPGRHKI